MAGYKASSLGFVLMVVCSSVLYKGSLFLLYFIISCCVLIVNRILLLIFNIHNFFLRTDCYYSSISLEKINISFTGSSAFLSLKPASLCIMIVFDPFSFK